MLTLRELRFKGIGRFVEEQSISFDNLGNLIQVDGLNKNTGGSSGAAKSTIFHSLDFLFGINTVPNGVLQSRLTEDLMTVEGDFDLDGRALTISRGKKLKIVLDGEVTTGSSKITEEKLDQLLAIPRHLFRPMLHKVQGERGFFLNFTPKETNDFLTDCLGLGRFRKHLEDLQKREVDLSNLIGSLTNQSAELKAKWDGLSSLHGVHGEAPKPTVDREVILRLKDAADRSAAALKSLSASQQAEKQALEASRPQLISLPFNTHAIKLLENEISALKQLLDSMDLAERNRLADVQQKVYEHKTKLDELRTSINKGASAKDEARRVALEVKKIRENLCPTCEQGWANDAAKQKEQQLLQKIEELKALISAGQLAETSFQEVENGWRALTLEMMPRPFGEEIRHKKRETEVYLAQEKKKEEQHYLSQTSAQRAQQDTFAKEQRDLAVKHEIALDQLRGQANLDRLNLERAVNEMKMYEESRTKYEKYWEVVRANEKDLSEKLEITHDRLDATKELLAEVEELKKVVKSYLSCCFDEALDFISETATRMVRNVPNMANATIQLKGIRETKEGKIKEEVNALLHLDGDENIDIRSLCGGERSAIDLAVDLSVIELIENKTNKGINIYILDEPFTGLDTVCIEMALEVLKNSTANKKLIVVDHNPEVKQMVESKLFVVRDGLTSTVTQES